MNATRGLEKAYYIENAAGVGQYVAVVQGANAEGNCQIPTAANAPRFLGITTETQPNQLKAVAVQKSNIARAIAHGTIARGDRVCIGSNAGDLASYEALIAAGLETPATEYNVVGYAEESAIAGQVFAVWLQPHTVALAQS
jgi:hypothetical protein